MYMSFFFLFFSSRHQAQTENQGSLGAQEIHVLMNNVGLPAAFPVVKIEREFHKCLRIKKCTVPNSVGF